MASRAQLLALHRRLIEELRGLIDHAVEADTLPTRSALSQIADFQQALMALQAMIEAQIPAMMLEAAE